MKKLLPLLALLLTGCQIGPNFYTLPETGHSLYTLADQECVYYESCGCGMSGEYNE